MEKFGFTWPEFVINVKRGDPDPADPEDDSVSYFEVDVSFRPALPCIIIAQNPATYSMTYGTYTITENDPIAVLKKWLTLEAERMERSKEQLKKCISQCIVANTFTLKYGSLPLMEVPDIYVVCSCGGTTISVVDAGVFSCAKCLGPTRIRVKRELIETLKPEIVK